MPLNKETKPSLENMCVWVDVLMGTRTCIRITHTLTHMEYIYIYKNDIYDLHGKITSIEHSQTQNRNQTTSKQPIKTIFTTPPQKKQQKKKQLELDLAI